MAKGSEPAPEIPDTSALTNADLAKVNKLKQAYEAGGQEALSEALENLADDPAQAIRIYSAYFPEMMREAIKDVMAEKGMTRQDLDELMGTHERKAPKKQ
jgi:hypothetical protein